MNHIQLLPPHDRQILPTANHADCIGMALYHENANPKDNLAYIVGTTDDKRFIVISIHTLNKYRINIRQLDQFGIGFKSSILAPHLNAKQLERLIADADEKEREDKRIKAQTNESFNLLLKQLIQLRPNPKCCEIIVAELHQNTSDLASSVYSCKTIKVIALDWYKQAELTFQQLRKAAKRHPDTAYLAKIPQLDIQGFKTIGKDIFRQPADHRTLDGEIYLKHGYRYSCGWCVKSVNLHKLAEMHHINPNISLLHPTNVPSSKKPEGQCRFRLGR